MLQFYVFQFYVEKKNFAPENGMGEGGGASAPVGPPLFSTALYK